MHELLDEPEEWASIRDAVRRILAKHATADDVRRWDAEHTYPNDLYQVLADAGYIAMPFPAEAGGGGAGPMEMLVIAEELGRRGMDIAGGYGMNVFLGMTIWEHGSQRLRTELIPAVLAGARRLSISLTEPGAGSDAANITTSVEAVPGGYRISGQKVFTSGAGLPHTSIAVAAKAERDGGRNAISVFVVDAETPGIEARRLSTVGRHMIGTYEVFFDGVFVPEDGRLGGEGEGWRVLNAGLTMERLFGCAAYLGSMDEVLQKTIGYARERRQFGQSIASFQAISHPLADMYTNHAAARLLVYSVGRLLASGAPARAEVSMAKLFISEAYQQATHHAMQVFGGYGYMTEYDIERYWRDARIATVTAGTSQVQREIICKSLGMR